MERHGARCRGGGTVSILRNHTNLSDPRSYEEHTKGVYGTATGRRNCIFYDGTATERSVFGVSGPVKFSGSTVSQGTDK